MKKWNSLVGLLMFVVCFTTAQTRKTHVTIRGEQFYTNDKITLKGVSWEGYTMEGLLPNSRMVQGIFDDMNPETVTQWAYPDTKKWDAARNNQEFIAAMKSWRKHGLLAFTINLQGGSPQGYSQSQPWHNSAFTETGELRPAYMARLERILDEADRLGMVVILGYFYFGQDERFVNEQAIIQAVSNATNWVLEKGYRNILIEINNECNVRYDHDILKPERVHELIELAKSKQVNGYRLLVSTSYGGGTLPKPNVVKASDYILLHGNGVSDSKEMTKLVEQTRKVEGYQPKPIVCNEDDHFNFDQPENNFFATTKAYASWGYFDFRMKDEQFQDGFQSVPVDWTINAPRKQAFFGLLKQITKKQRK